MLPGGADAADWRAHFEHHSDFPKHLKALPYMPALLVVAGLGISVDISQLFQVLVPI